MKLTRKSTSSQTKPKGTIVPSSTLGTSSKEPLSLVLSQSELDTSSGSKCQTLASRCTCTRLLTTGLVPLTPFCTTCITLTTPKRITSELEPTYGLTEIPFKTTVYGTSWPSSKPLKLLPCGCNETTSTSSAI